jgi:hypothetical protein
VKVTIATGIELDSPQEALFYGLCCFHEIPVIRNTPALGGVVDGQGGWYAPGFYVAVEKMLELFVEVADGTEDVVRRNARERWRKLGMRRLAVLYRDDLDQLRDAGRPAQFVARLRLIGGRWQ